MKYVLAYYGGGMGATEAEQAATMQKWGAWFGGLGGALADGGLPFSGAVKTVGPSGSVSDGPIGERATGYSILEADSVDAAAELAKGCPVLASGGSIAVYETIPM
ncbi:MAG TPA: YciI family protein [Candidatus Dormibacteraeota bacterium]|jgi:hypothetical protein|nr:YciI family protein [Candidatus Dormibacteraeota bacterium]